MALLSLFFFIFFLLSRDVEELKQRIQEAVATTVAEDMLGRYGKS